MAIKKEVKSKNIFSILTAIFSKDSNYYDKLTESEKKLYNIFMINRYISSNYNYIELVNEWQKYSFMVNDRINFKFYQNILPDKNEFLKYQKYSGIEKYNSELLKYVSKYFEISTNTAKYYVSRYLLNNDTKEELISILQSFGLDKRKILEMINDTKL